MDARIVVREATDVAEVRRLASRLAIGEGFPENRVGRVALVATEAAGNLRKHAGGGQVLMRAVTASGEPAVEILALDKGPGIADLGKALDDGHSTAPGSLGTGLGAIRRLSDMFEIVSTPEAGTAIFVRIRRSPLGRTSADSTRSSTLRVGAVSVAQPGESVCGDAWSFRATEHGGVVLVADGLGHGPYAAEAAQAAVSAFQACDIDSLPDAMNTLHAALRNTRGAAIALADLDVDDRRVCYVGVGNIGARIETPDGRYHALVSVEGTAGVAVRQTPEFAYEWPSGTSVLILHSDGLSSRWELGSYRGIFAKDPAMVAAVLYRDFWRGRDDATVVAVKQADEGL